MQVFTEFVLISRTENAICEIDPIDPIDRGKMMSGTRREIRFWWRVSWAKYFPSFHGLRSFRSLATIELIARSAAVNPQVCSGFNLITIAKDNSLLSQLNASEQIRSRDRLIWHYYILEEFPRGYFQVSLSLFACRSRDNRGIICRRATINPPACPSQRLNPPDSLFFTWWSS